jgi:hypothetical protein
MILYKQGLRTITVGDCKRDADLEHGGKERHCVFEKVVGNLHDSGSVLAGISFGFQGRERERDSHDGNIRILLHLQGGIHETILWHSSIGINQ